MTRPPPTLAISALDRTALAAVLLTPLLLLHAHGIAEGAIAVADLCFLIRAAMLRDWDWLRTPWLWIGLAWWGWLVLCSLPIQFWVSARAAGIPWSRRSPPSASCCSSQPWSTQSYATQPARRWLFGLIAASAIYIEAQSLIQWLFGRNLYGDQGSLGQRADRAVRPSRAPRLRWRASCCRP